MAMRQALPGWNVLLLSKEPVALNIEDCAQHDIIMAASGAQVCMDPNLSLMEGSSPVVCFASYDCDSLTTCCVA